MNWVHVAHIVILAILIVGCSVEKQDEDKFVSLSELRAEIKKNRVEVVLKTIERKVAPFKRFTSKVDRILNVAVGELDLNIITPFLRLNPEEMETLRKHQFSFAKLLSWNTLIKEISITQKTGSNGGVVNFISFSTPIDSDFIIGKRKNCFVHFLGTVRNMKLLTFNINLQINERTFALFNYKSNILTFNLNGLFGIMAELTKNNKVIAQIYSKIESLYKRFKFTFFIKNNGIIQYKHPGSSKGYYEHSFAWGPEKYTVLIDSGFDDNVLNPKVVIQREPKNKLKHTMHCGNVSRNEVTEHYRKFPTYLISSDSVCWNTNPQNSWWNNEGWFYVYDNAVQNSKLVNAKKGLPYWENTVIKPGQYRLDHYGANTKLEEMFSTSLLTRLTISVMSYHSYTLLSKERYDVVRKHPSIIACSKPEDDNKIRIMTRGQLYLLRPNLINIWCKPYHWEEL